MTISAIRSAYHRQLCKEIIRIKQNKAKGDYPNFADGDSKSSREIAWGIVRQLGCPEKNGNLKAQTVGKLFENVTKIFLENAFKQLAHLRPGEWRYSTEKTEISGFDQYEHLSYIKDLVRNDSILASALGGNYIVRPDIVISRSPVSDEEINRRQTVIGTDDISARYTPLRQVNHTEPCQILHASISCKWTIRNDRAQNTRTEALNLIRNRKGNQPHIVAVTAEPLPMRIAALALGTGDLDCVYHFALPELKSAAEEAKNQDQSEMLDMMVSGKRLRDISDLPFDLAI
ncbi:restriction endonuclease [Desulfonema ishimotonii]|uniref:Restriction endonuclease n=1 Tax=Desulfonema ishimotonii TaxID=45657 RepID=A0A401FTZ0_9BACT|nr:NgoMIV family type II restriction endonuclease [Desulfonema ishimotonii]GBC60447.1 restriction endonuclease [Desulfonema ishimotonii]